MRSPDEGARKATRALMGDHYLATYAAACALALAIACHGRNVRDAAPHIETIVYTDGQLMYSEPETLTVRADGTIEYESHTNVTRPAQQDIGVYAATLPEGTLRDLESALSDPPLETLPDHSGRLLVDGRPRTVRVTSDHATVTRMVNEEPVDPRLEHVLVRLDGLSKIALRSPRRALHVEMDQVTVDEHRAMVAIAVFSNQSPEAVECRVPTSLVGGERGLLAFDSWQDTEPRAHPWVRSPVSAVEELSRSGGATVRGLVLDLPPGAAVSYRIRATLAEADDGPSSVQLVYRHFETAGGPPMLAGELRATAKVTVPKSASAFEPSGPR
jgi:hypothetical protein